MPRFYLFVAIALSFALPLEAALPHILGWGEKPATSEEREYAEKHLKEARKLLKKIDRKSKRSGYSTRYALPNYPNSLYKKLAANPDLVSLYAKLCQAIYNVANTEGGESLSYPEVADIIDEDLLAEFGYALIDIMPRWDQFSGAILYNQSLNTMLIVYAGTASKMDAWKDLVFTRHPGGDPYGVVPKNYNVHNGFAQGLIEGLVGFKERFMNIADAALGNDDLQIITMGHSLGGGVGLLAADFIVRVYIPELEKTHPAVTKVSHISFGAPRIYSKETAVEVERRLGKGNVIRFWSSIDPVPAVVSGYITNSKHVGLPFKIHDSILRQTIPGLGWHSMDWYEKKAQSSFELYLKKVKT